MNTREVAEKLETTPKILRKFLREVDPQASVGSGGRYTFEASDIPRLKKKFQEWAGDRALMNGKSYIKGDGEPGMSAEILRRKPTRQEKDKIKAAAEARVDRLEAALRAKGLHISQMK